MSSHGESSSSSSSSSSSAEIIASSDDLLSEILRRLPVKSLLKFKSVSKHWRSLITDPQFCRRKIHNLKPPYALFLQDQAYSDLFFVPLDPSDSDATGPFTPIISFARRPRDMEIKHSCNGLFCCYSTDYDLDNWPVTFYICNPTTKQFRTLPPLHGADKPVCGMTVAFDPSESHLYKVICVQYVGSPPEATVQIQIYSPETGSWRLCGAGARFEAQAATDFSSGVYLNGVIHWVSHMGTVSLYFDVKEEVIREMPMPPRPGEFDERAIRYFGETMGHLHLVENDMFPATDLNVYEMKSDRSGWFVKFRVNLDAVALTAVPPGYINQVHYFKCGIVCVVRAGVEDEDSFLVVHVPGKIVAYNINTKSHCKICDFDFCFYGDTYPWIYAFQFIESLSPV